MTNSTITLDENIKLIVDSSKRPQPNTRDYSEPSISNMTAYAAPALPRAFLYAPLWIILPAIYVKYFGLELTAVAAVLFYARMFDGITDISIGYLSDRHRITGGSRKLWVLVGGLGVVISCYFLFSPPDTVTATYYLLWSLAFFLAFTLIEVPHLAWGSELTLNYNRRAKVYTIYSMFWGAGATLFYAVPLLPIYESSEFTPEILKDTGYVGSVIMLSFLLWTYFYAPDGIIVKSEKKDTFKLLFHSIIKNKPLLIYFSAYGCFGLSMGMLFGLLYLYLDSYLKCGELLAISFLLGGITGVLCLPLWQKLINKTSKATTWAAGILLFCTIHGCFIFVSPGDTGWIIGILAGASQIGLHCSNTCSAATLGDIIDYGKLKFHQDRGSTYFAVNNLILKLGLGLGGGFSLGLAGLFDFDPSNSTHSASSIIGIQLGFIYLPVLLSLISITLIFLIPITKRRHNIIHRRLASRSQ